MNIGYDTASIDGNTHEDIEGAKQYAAQSASRLSFAILRATYGTWIDTAFQRDWELARAAGLVRGAYAFLRFPYLPTGYTAKDESPEDQMHAFAHAVGTHDDYDFVPTIDVEFPGNGLIDTGMSPTEALAWVRRAWKAIVDIYGVPPMIYTSARVWADDLHNLPAADLTDSPLWLAKPWPIAERMPAQCSGVPYIGGKLDPQIPAPWGARSGDWWIHQYQGDARNFGMSWLSPNPNGGDPIATFKGIRQCDLSRFNLCHEGEKSVRVSWIQRRLGLEETGLFDAALTSHVAAFQQQLGLDADGVIGPRTFAPLTWKSATPQLVMPPAAA